MMRFSPLLSAAAMALLASPAVAQTVSSGARIAVPSQNNLFSWERGHGFKGGFGGGVWIVEREVPVVVEKEVVRDSGPPPAPAAAEAHSSAQPSPGRPARFVIGATYDALPGGCMKLIEEGASYYYCGDGEWYRQTGEGRSASYRAVQRKL